MITISDDQFLGLVREAVASQVAELRPLIRKEIARELEFVTEEEGVSILAIVGKDPTRTFRRLMNDHGVHRMTLQAGSTVYKLFGPESVMAIVGKRMVKPPPRRGAKLKLVA